MASPWCLLLNRIGRQLMKPPSFVLHLMGAVAPHDKTQMVAKLGGLVYESGATGAL